MQVGIAGSNPVVGMGVCILWFHLFSDSGLCDWSIPLPEKSYRVCECVCFSVRSGTTLALYTYNEQAEKDQNKKESRELLIYVSPVIIKAKLRIMKAVR
jgi:hypothetical protein